jgi:DNA polymerase-3 subunit delta'
MAKRSPRNTDPRDARAEPIASVADQPAATPAPRDLCDILGQPHAIDTLTRALDSGRIHHAWIFHGPPGVGKCTAALAFGALLLDPSAQRTFTGEWSRDPDSHASRLMAAGAHPDLHLVTKELALYDEDRQVRERKLISIPKAVIDRHLLRPAALAAQMQGGLASKVFIVDEAELLDRHITNAPVQNAILKTLEEPPARTVIILVTSSEERLLPTIRSRCQRVRFTALDHAAMQAWVASWTRERAGGTGEAGSGSRPLSPESIAWLMEFAEGSPGMFALAAQEGLDQWADALGGPLTTALSGKYALGLGATMSELVEAKAKAAVDAAENASKEAASRRAAEWMLRVVCARARGALRREAGAPGSDRLEALLRAIDAVREAEEELDANVNQMFVFEKLAAEIAAGSR